MTVYSEREYIATVEENIITACYHFDTREFYQGVIWPPNQILTGKSVFLVGDFLKEDIQVLKISRRDFMSKVRKCKIGRRSKKRQIAELLKKYGDIPKKEIPKAVSYENLKMWECLCDGNRIVSIARREKTDWYSQTIKNLVTHPDYRGKGYGKQVVKKALAKAIKDNGHVIIADVTYDNIPSKKIFERLGFNVVNRFCWKEGEKPADILHYVWTHRKNKCGKDYRL